MTLRVFVVEDEEYVRDEIKFMLGKYDELEIVGDTDNSFDAICSIQALKPDVAFLDIKLGDVSGLVLAKKIRELEPKTRIVFVTAYDAHAVEGFELDAVDYVLKPFSEERLAKTVRKLLKSEAPDNTTARDEAASSAKPPYAKAQDKLIMRKKQTWKLVEVSDICYFQSQEHRTAAVTEEDTYSLNYTLKELEDQLPAAKFLRTHKSFIVNTDYIDEIVPWFNYTFKIKLKNCTEEIPVGRNYMKQFKSTLAIS
ncbi:LytTR family DNA-binding domain-containing protein [Synergistaceae bacterium OttesenSCG-928-D05]|nr:LytTR family DNA-binding domain-containing protein [Synergistaceae bacterium OttesenSCG-928-D05]